MFAEPGARSIRRTALAAAMALAATAAASAQTAPAGLRGPQPAARPPSPREEASQAPAAAARPVQPPTLAAIGDRPPADLDQDPAPRFALDPAPRISGLSPGPGGAQCRTSCAEDRYLCRSQEPPERCDSVWSQCVAACPEASPGAL